MVLQIEDTRKADSIVGALLPFPLCPLAALKVGCALRDGRMIGLPSGHQAQHGPGSLRR